MQFRLLFLPFVAALLLLPSCGKPPPAPTQTSAPAQVATVTSLAALDSKPHPIGHIDPQNPYPTPELSLPGDCILTGTVLDPDGKPVSGAQVSFSNEYLKLTTRARFPPDVTWAHTREALLTRPSVVTDAEGRFVFNYLYAGRTDLWATTSTSIGWTRQVETTARDITIRLAPKTDALTFDGTLFDTDGKTPFAGAPIILLLNSKSIAETETDPSGHYHLQCKPDPATDSFSLVAVPQDHAIAWCILPNCSAANLDLQLKPRATLTGRVLDPKRQPVSGAKLQLMAPVDPQYGSLYTRGNGDFGIPGPGLTNKDGSYSVTGFPLGSRMSVLVTRHPDYLVNNLWDLQTREARQEVPDILLEEFPVIEGTVYLSGKPVPNVAVANGYQPGTYSYASAISDSNGHYRLKITQPQSQQRISAELGGTPPQWEASVLTDHPLRAGEHVTLDLTLKPPLASLEAQWKLIAGTPRASTYNVAILDDCDPDYRGKTTYDDTLSVRNSAGDLLWQKGLNLNTSTAHTLAADPQRKTIWVCEEIAGTGNRLLQYSYSRDLIFEKPDVKPFGVALDPKTGNAWVINGTGSVVPGDKLLVFSPKGEKLHEWDIKALDVAYSAHDDCFWIAGKDLWKLDRDGNVSANVHMPSDSDRICVNETDGSVWVSMRTRAFSTSAQVLIVEPDGAVRKTLSGSCLAIDSLRKVVWRSGAKTNLDGNLLAEFSLGVNCCVIEPDTGYVWVSTWKSGLYRLDPDGKPVWHDPSLTPKVFCLVPQ